MRGGDYGRRNPSQEEEEENAEAARRYLSVTQAIEDQRRRLEQSLRGGSTELHGALLLGDSTHQTSLPLPFRHSQTGMAIPSFSSQQSHQLLLQQSQVQQQQQQQQQQQRGLLVQPFPASIQERLNALLEEDYQIQERMRVLRQLREQPGPFRPSTPFHSSSHGNTRGFQSGSSVSSSSVGWAGHLFSSAPSGASRAGRSDTVFHGRGSVLQNPTSITHQHRNVANIFPHEDSLVAKITHGYLGSVQASDMTRHVRLPESKAEGKERSESENESAGTGQADNILSHRDAGGGEPDDDDNDATMMMDDDEFFRVHPRGIPRGAAQPDSAKGGKKREPFPLKLYRLLYEAEKEGFDDIISFASHGRSFLIHKPDKFVSKIMPKYFPSGRMNTFLKQLNLYSFQRIPSGRDKGGYFHELFQKGKRPLCLQIKRKWVDQTKKQSSKTKVHGSDQKPGGTSQGEMTPPYAAVARVVASSGVDSSSSSEGDGSADVKKRFKTEK